LNGPPPQGPDLPPPPLPEWRFASEPDPAAVERLASALSLPPPLCGILATRKLLEPEAARDFLRPRLEHLHPPERIRDLDRAARRILSAVGSGETILVHGDYDVDGVSGAALLTLWLRRLGGTAVPFVPHRVRDGYDFGPAGLRAASAAGATLLVTCDSGTVAHDAVEQAVSRGIDVIVTDHHTPGHRLPPAFAVVNPNRRDDEYPTPHLCGTGVIFKLCQHLAALADVPLGELWPHLDLVALATIADLVPLTGENRTLVRFGLRYLAATTKPGLRALLQTTGLDSDTELESGQVGFVLAPRINAAGRLGEADAALRLLLTRDHDEARALAELLERTNRDRREADRVTLDEVLSRLPLEYDPERDFGVVLAGDGWHPGVIGIVASRLVERIHRPVVLVTFDGNMGKGSARSIPDVHVLEAISAGAGSLVRFGGHEQAAGLEIERSSLPAFRASFNESVRLQLEGRHPRPRVTGDAPLALAELNEDLARFLGYVGPFGIGNPRPVFWARGLEQVRAPKVVGAGHLKLRLRDGTREIDAIGFGLAARRPPESLGRGPVDALFQLRRNDYAGRSRLEARLVDLKPSSA
jgi:single-stranded-DNA-specific exonuclease